METNETAIHEWLTETPEHQETKHILMVEGYDGSCDRRIELTSEEYDALKGFLAQSRGIAGPQGVPA